MVCVLVDERSALLESVEASGDGCRGVGGCSNVAEEGVLVCDQRGLEGCLCGGEVGEGGHLGLGCGGGGFACGFGFADEGAHVSYIFVVCGCEVGRYMAYWNAIERTGLNWILQADMQTADGQRGVYIHFLLKRVSTLESCIDR